MLSEVRGQKSEAFGQLGLVYSKISYAIRSRIQTIGESWVFGDDFGAGEFFPPNITARDYPTGIYNQGLSSIVSTLDTTKSAGLGCNHRWHMMEEITESAILDKMLEPVVRCFTPAVARQIAELRADQVTQARIDELAVKCNEGDLTEAEKREYGAYVDAIDLIGILQAKTRTILASPSHR